ncbi:MAG: universal stress protein [Candidatus Eremiobacterota bacterium]
MFRKILVPLDGSVLSEQALPMAAEQARASGGELMLLHSMHLPEDLMWLPSLSEPLLSWKESVRRSCEEYLARVRERAGDVPVQVAIPEGEPARAILDAAERHGSDLIAMVTHGRTGPGRWLLGSVAARVMRHAPCPVLLVRARADSNRSFQGLS